MKYGCFGKHNEASETFLDFSNYFLNNWINKYVRYKGNKLGSHLAPFVFHDLNIDGVLICLWFI